MLPIAEVAALVAATKGAVDIFDKIAGQLKSVILKRPKEAEGEDDRWRYKIGSEGGNIVVKQDQRTIQTITGAELATKLGPQDLALVSAYEHKMDEYFSLWQSVYSQKDSSQDPLVNAKTDAQLKNLIGKMRGELLGILNFLTKIGVHLDDHYMHVRQLVEQT
jgi:hypothetical protein